MLRPSGTISCCSRGVFRETIWDRRMLALEFEADLAVCAELDATAVVPLMLGNHITLGAPAAP